jgi:hypothetical protein
VNLAPGVHAVGLVPWNALRAGVLHAVPCQVRLHPACTLGAVRAKAVRVVRQMCGPRQEKESAFLTIFTRVAGNVNGYCAVWVIVVTRRKQIRDECRETVHDLLPAGCEPFPLPTACARRRPRPGPLAAVDVRPRPRHRPRSALKAIKEDLVTPQDGRVVPGSGRSQRLHASHHREMAPSGADWRCCAGVVASIGIICASPPRRPPGSRRSRHRASATGRR